GLKRYPLHPDALIGAQRLIETHQRRGRLDQARRARLEVASRFVPASAWAKAQASDSVRSAGSQFARASWKTVALEHHRKARDAGSRDDWREALQLYQKLLSTWPEDAEAPALRLNAGEASAQLGEYPAALEHYAAAAATGRDSVASHALWQRVAVTDAWYQSTRAARGRERTGLGSDSLGRAVITAGDELLDRFSDHPESGSILWRQANLAFGHGWFERAASDFGRMIVEHPKDARSPVAAGLRADALFRTERFEAAGIAYEEALTAARRAGLDSLERHAAAAIPISWYRHAESVVAADSSNHAQHAALFEKLATRWPQYEHAHVARYRAGLAYLRAGSARDAVRVLEALIRDHPKSEYVQDAHLQIAHAWEAAGEREKAAQAYADFAERYPKDASAGDAWLKAADLFAAAGSEPKADALRLTYIRTFPNDVENAMEILEGLGRRELAGIAPGRPISSLLMASGSSKTAAASSHLADYLRRAEAHPKLASPSLLAQVRFLEGEEANTAYSAARLPQPLERSIPAKQKLLEKTLASYRKAVDLGVPEWAHASAFRIGEALVAFGEALEKSQRPADLTGDDLVAYEDVLYRQRDGFFDRGEGVWMELLRSQSREAQADEWIARTRTSLWGRLANRFYFRPEVEFPLAAASPPGRLRPDSKASDTESATARESLGTAPERTPGAHQP
ncbi:MAG TPA: tetratricopeptide repeat protein, partial [Candidatus Limnocylindria bacterium]|nr:tetratricopeptide repeat protein [Candidatus Limnocylindria bacterium]